MYKLFLAFLIAFLAIWFADKSFIPNKVMNSMPGRIINATLLPYEFKINKKFKKNLVAVPSLVEIDAGRAASLISSVKAVNKNVVIFFYDTQSFFSKYILSDINELAHEYKNTNNDSIFLVVAFEDDREKVEFLLQDIGKLYFRPIYTKAANSKAIFSQFKDSNIGISDLPAVVYKNSDGLYENLPADFGTKSILKTKIEQK